MSEFDEAIPKPRDLVLLLDQVILKWDSLSFWHLQRHSVSIRKIISFRNWLTHSPLEISKNSVLKIIEWFSGHCRAKKN